MTRGYVTVWWDEAKQRTAEYRTKKHNEVHARLVEVRTGTTYKLVKKHGVGPFCTLDTVAVEGKENERRRVFLSERKKQAGRKLLY